MLCPRNLAYIPLTIDITLSPPGTYRRNRVAKSPQSSPRGSLIRHPVLLAARAALSRCVDRLICAYRVEGKHLVSIRAGSALLSSCTRPRARSSSSVMPLRLQANAIPGVVLLLLLWELEPGLLFTPPFLLLLSTVLLVLRSLL